MIQRIVNTHLRSRDEMFNVLALGESTGLPVLLVGEKGTGKTQGALDYIGRGKSWVCQTSLGTRPNDIRGIVDMNAWINDKKYRTISPITEADCIVVDEIDKTSDSVRDLLLSVMREKKLFLGTEGSKQCRWKLFVGCCNTKPQDTPFWDRFVIRYNVERLPQEDMSQLFDTSQRNLIKVPVLNGELVSLSFTEKENSHLMLLTKLGYDSLSDRTISYLPRLYRAVQLIWKMDEDESIVKLASLLNPLLVPGLYNAFLSNEKGDSNVEAVKEALKEETSGG